MIKTISARWSQRHKKVQAIANAQPVVAPRYSPIDAMNPIFARELKARWRRPLTYIIVLAYSAILSWVAWQIYGNYFILLSSGNGSGSAGANFFTAITTAQMILWTLMAPMLTAPAITRERELNMLTELLLSGLTPRQIVRGKLKSALAFVAVLLLVPLPIGALCFQMGGVSPLDFALAFALQAAIATAGASVGLMCSAGSRKTISAMVAAMLLSGGALLLVVPTGVALHSNTVLIALSGIFVCALLTLAMIDGAEQALKVSQRTPEHWLSAPPQPASASLPTSATEPWRLQTPAGPDATPIGALQVVDAERFPPAPIDWHSQSPHRAAREAAAALTVAVPQSEIAAETEAINPAHTGGEAAQGPWLQQFAAPRTPENVKPWIQKVIERCGFDNAILNRELRVRFRALKPTKESPDYDGSDLHAFFVPWLMPMWAMAGLVLRAWSDAWIPALAWFLAGISFACATMGATAFTREREQSMLQMLITTRLTPRDILLGKIAVPLVVSTYYGSIGAVILLVWGASMSMGIALPLTALLLMASFAWCAAACGVFLSWFCRHTAIAAIGAVALFGGILIAPSILRELVNYKLAILLREWWFNPVVQPLFQFDRPLSVLIAGAIFSAILCLIGQALLSIVAYGLRPGTLDKETKSLLHTDLTRGLN